MTDHIEIRDRRAEVLSKYPGLQVGRNGIAEQYISSDLNNSVNDLNRLLGIVTKLNSKSGEEFERFYDELCVFLLNIFEYEDFLESLLIPEVKKDTTLREVLLGSDDIKPIINALDQNTRKLKSLGEDIPRTMTQEDWKDQGKVITQQIVDIVKKQKQLVTLGIQDEVVESVDGVAKQVFDIMHIQNAEFLEGKNRGSDIHLMASESLSNILLEEYGLKVGDVIAREMLDDTHEYTIGGIGHVNSYLSYPNQTQEATKSFKTSLNGRDESKLTLFFSDPSYPENYHIVSLSSITIVDVFEGIFKIDDHLTYMKI